MVIVMSEYPKQPDDEQGTRQVNMRLDPMQHNFAERARVVVGLPTIGAMYALAMEEYFQNHPDVADAVEKSLKDEATFATRALERLAEYRERPQA